MIDLEKYVIAEEGFKDQIRSKYNEIPFDTKLGIVTLASLATVITAFSIRNKLRSNKLKKTYSTYRDYRKTMFIGDDKFLKMLGDAKAIIIPSNYEELLETNTELMKAVEQDYFPVIAEIFKIIRTLSIDDTLVDAKRVKIAENNYIKVVKKLQALKDAIPEISTEETEFTSALPFINSLYQYIKLANGAERKLWDYSLGARPDDDDDGTASSPAVKYLRMLGGIECSKFIEDNYNDAAYIRNNWSKDAFIYENIKMKLK